MGLITARLLLTSLDWNPCIDEEQFRHPGHVIVVGMHSMSIGWLGRLLMFAGVGESEKNSCSSTWVAAKRQPSEISIEDVRSRRRTAGLRLLLEVPALDPDGSGSSDRFYGTVDLGAVSTPPGSSTRGFDENLTRILDYVATRSVARLCQPVSGAT